MKGCVHVPSCNGALRAKGGAAAARSAGLARTVGARIHGRDVRQLKVAPQREAAAQPAERILHGGSTAQERACCGVAVGFAPAVAWQARRDARISATGQN